MECFKWIRVKYDKSFKWKLLLKMQKLAKQIMCGPAKIRLILANLT